MTKTIRYCDQCGEPDALEFQYFVRRELDGAGDTDNVYGYIDLCHVHTLALLHDVEKQAGAKIVIPLVEMARSIGKKRVAA